MGSHRRHLRYLRIPFFILCGAAAVQAESAPIWSGESAGYRIRWDEADITANKEDGGSLVFSARQAIERAYRSDQEESERDDAEINAQLAKDGKAPIAPNPCTAQHELSLLSVVGPLVSLQDRWSTTCAREAHPAAETRLFAIDLSRCGAGSPAAMTDCLITLSDVFPAATLLKVLRGDRLIRQALKQSAVPNPQSLDALVEALPSAVAGGQGCYAFPPDVLTRFAFHHLENGKVAVRIGLPGAAVCRDRLTQIGLLLPTPPPIRPALQAARKGSAGFLMGKLPAIAGGRKASFTLGRDGTKDLTR